jgi:predicted HTH domain antitoxin
LSQQGGNFGKGPFPKGVYPNPDGDRRLMSYLDFCPNMVSLNRLCLFGDERCAMQTITMDLPEDAFTALRRSPDEFAREMRLAAAMLWYSRGMVSQEKAAEIAGLNRSQFLAALAHDKIDVFTVDFEDLKEELERG